MVPMVMIVVMVMVVAVTVIVMMMVVVMIVVVIMSVVKFVAEHVAGFDEQFSDLVGGRRRFLEQGRGFGMAGRFSLFRPGFVVGGVVMVVVLPMAQQVSQLIHITQRMI